PPQPTAATASPKAAASSAEPSLRTRQGHRPEDEGLLKFLTLAVLAGFLALATPCVFPMIPITVSYFTKQGNEGSSNIGGALVYCLGIVGTFTGLGLLLAGLFGASGIARFAANAWVNLAIAAIFITLALSLMGYFELALPPALANRASALSGKGGLLGTLLMGLTFTLTSFTCTVPFVGTLLVSTTQGSWLWPALGMLAFSSAFASPFFLLALFPQLLGKMPRAGMWLIVVKAFMGFLELAAAIKFLSNADLVWQAHLLTRAVFLILWAAIGIASGLYLLGLLRLSHLDRGPVGPGRRGLGVLMVLAGLYCAAAVGGAPLGPFDAYAPPEGYGFHHDTVGLHGWIQEYPPALAEARRERKPLFLDFTGYTCTNCRWMEANVFPQPAVQGELSRFVKAELYTDGAAQPSGHNRDLELKLFDTVALPLYAVVDTDGKPIDVFYGLTRDPQEFATWLKGAREKSGLGG
ncbi:MAG: thioredoxin family protein, partial [Armatimonadota bacterium]|nr:thioredoxin family protein [Armatimonadota bacterium]